MSAIAARGADGRRTHRRATLLFREKHREDVPRWLRRPGLLAGLEGPAVAEDAPLYPGATDVLVLSPA